MTFSGYFIRVWYFLLGVIWGGALAGEWAVLAIGASGMLAAVIALFVKSALDLRADP
jgi:hypothetical protein